MSRRKKGDIKLNKNHQGKEFTNNFRFVGKVNPVRKKDEDSDSWYDVEFYEETTTQTDKQRRVLQFNVETAFKNELKVEMAGMEKPNAYAWSSKHKKVAVVDWDDRFDKSKLPDDTYHFMQNEWDATEKISKWLEKDMWVDVRGHYEFDTFVSDSGEEIKLNKRVIDQVFPLKNGMVIVKDLKEGEMIKVYDSAEDGLELGYAKAGKEGVAEVRVGWLNPTGGLLYICKVEKNNESERVKQEYNDSITENGKIIVENNITNDIRVQKSDGSGYEYIPYIRDFKDENFIEINTFDMQIGIRSTYQDDETKDTKVNAVFLDYGKERSVPKEVELTVYYKEATDGKKSLADAFASLEPLDFMVVEGIDHNRAEFTFVEVEETEKDNPFEDVGEKVSDYERVTSGTKKGLEILRYVGGTFKRGLLTEEEITPNLDAGNPFETIKINDDDLPF